MTLQITLGSLEITGLNGLDPNGSQWSVDSFTGWGTAKPTTAVIQKPRQDGGWIGQSYEGSRHMVITGQLSSLTQDGLTVSLDALATAVTLAESTMTVVEGARTRYVKVRREDEILTSYISDKMATWSVAVVAEDPRKFSAPIVQTSALPSTTGGVTIPYRIPYVIAANVVTGSITLGNPGNKSGPVVLRIDGPCTAPVITHTSSTGAPSVFATNLTLGVGEFLLVDMDAHTVLANGQSSRMSSVTSRGFSTFDVGVNTWSFTASAYDPTALLTVTATPAYL
ncbi:hypothetical protein ACFRFH_12150 [Leifsonia sp. NPDC056824]|uniref:hypothetical protein n=1 Tax=Leifsonia sp. NPDC056824 TaxID=3345953 RepID=UPI003691CB6E